MILPIHQPLRFEPFFRALVWGGRRIARFLGKNLPTPDPHGESWEVSDHPIHFSQLATASFHGVTLRQLMEQAPADLLGPAANRCASFPWLIKLLDVEGRLSIQVHPDEEAVKNLCPGEAAKTEGWYILEAAPESHIWAGLKPGIGSAELRRAIADGTVADCLHAFTPAAGDFIYLPAGTVHALGGGVLLAEIQQTSNATFRLHDWNRSGAAGQPRSLHIDEALASIHWDQGPITPIRAGGKERETLIAGAYFNVEFIRPPGSFALGGAGCLQALIVTDGQGRFDNGEFFMAGDVWVLPAAMPPTPLQCDRPLAGLLCTLPE